MTAFYDTMPPKLQPVGNGSFLYHWNIQEVEAPVNAEDETPRTQYQCEEVTVWPPLTANKILEAVVTDKWDKNFEQKLVNDYNAAKLSLYDNSATSAAAKEKIQRYKDFLNERKAIKEIVDGDCLELDIE